jgi:hypothetical protein
LALKDLFNNTLSGCKWKVNSSEITARSVFFLSVLCAVKKSNTKRDFGLLPCLACLAQTFSIYQAISSSFIQPFGLAQIITPSGNSCRIFANLKIITGGNFIPSAM